MGLEREGNSLGAELDVVVRINDGTNNGVGRCLVGGNDGNIAAHNLNIGELAHKCAICRGNEALGTDAYIYRLVLNTGNIENAVLAEVELATGNYTLKYIDGGSSKELGNKEVGRIVINRLVRRSEELRRRPVSPPSS